MKKLFHLILRSPVVKAAINPSFGKVKEVRSGKICIVLSEENMLGDLVIHNFIVQQLTLYGYSVAFCVSTPFYRRFRFFFEEHCMAVKVFVLPEKGRDLARFAGSIRKEGIKAVILDECPQVDAVFFYRAGVPVIIGPSEKRSPFYSREYRLNKLELHYTGISGALLQLLEDSSEKKGQHVISPYFPYRDIPIGEFGDRKDAGLAVHMGGGNYWNRKWPQERYIEICRLFLRHYEGKLFLIGGQDEYQANEEIRHILVETEDATGRVINCCGSDLHRTASVIAASKAFIGNDSAPMHIAVALNKRVMGIFGPSAISVVNPTQYDQRNITIRSYMECVPCNNAQCRLPDDKKLSCLTSLSTDMVWEHLQRVI